MADIIFSKTIFLDKFFYYDLFWSIDNAPYKLNFFKKRKIKRQFERFLCIILAKQEKRTLLIERGVCENKNSKNSIILFETTNVKNKIIQEFSLLYKLEKYKNKKRYSHYYKQLKHSQYYRQLKSCYDFNHL